MAASLGSSTQHVEKLIAKFDADKARHDRMVALVERMLELNKRTGGLGPPATGKHAGAQRAPLPTIAGGDTGATELEREIGATDEEIDNLVYELYGITEEERRVIEGT